MRPDRNFGTPPYIPLYRKLLYSLFTLAVIFLLLEGTSRIYLWSIESRVKSGSRLERNKVDLPPRTDDSFRIFLYGESTVYGEPTPEVGFSAQLKFYLDRLGTGTRIETYNYGRPGEGSSYVLDVLSRTIHNKPDLAIILVGHNEFLTPAPGAKALLVTLTERSAFIRVMEHYLTSLTVWLIKKWKAEPPQQDISRVRFENTVERYRENVRKMIKIARGQGVPLILCTAPYNRFWPPEYVRGKETVTGFDQDVVLIYNLLQRHEFGKAKSLLRTLLNNNADNPTLFYLLGRIHFSEGAYAQAAMALGSAKEHDPFRIRVPDVLNVFLREVTNRDGVYLLDLDESLAKQSPYGILGYELLADNCHPTPEGGYVIAQDLITAIRENNIPGITIPLDKSQANLDAFLASQRFLQQDSMLRFGYLMELARYHLSRSGPSEPLPFKAGVARIYLEQAMKIQPDDWRVWANMATTSFLRGSPTQGRLEFQTAVRLSNGHIDLSEEAVPHLAKTLKLFGLIPESR